MPYQESTEERTVYQVYEGDPNEDGQEISIFFSLASHKRLVPSRRRTSQGTASQSSQDVSAPAHGSNGPNFPEHASNLTVTETYAKYTLDCTAFRMIGMGLAYGEEDVSHKKILKVGRQTFNDQNVSSEEIVAQVLDRFQAGGWQSIFEEEEKIRLNIMGFEDFDLKIDFDCEDAQESCDPYTSTFAYTNFVLVHKLNQALQKHQLDTERALQRDLEIRLLENRINTLNLELADKTLQLISLFQGGGPIVEGVSGTGESIQREATSQHVDTVSTSKKRKVEPTLAEADLLE